MLLFAASGVRSNPVPYFVVPYDRCVLTDLLIVLLRRPRLIRPAPGPTTMTY